MELNPRERSDTTSLAGDGFTLRRWRHSDAPALKTVCGDPEICCFTSVPEVYSPGAARAWIDRQHGRERGGTCVFAIELAGKTLPVGNVWIFDLGGSFGGPLLGYWVAADERRRMLGTAAVRLCGDWAFRVLRSPALYIEFDRRNVGSRALTERLGARRVGTVSRRIFGVGLPYDRYELLAPSWGSPPAAMATAGTGAGR